jgi:spore maturation protein CgeB
MVEEKNPAPLVNKIMFLETISDYYTFSKNFYLTLKRLAKEVIVFNRRDYYFKQGKDFMNNLLLKTIKKEKPDYIFTWFTWDEFYIDTLLQIRKISPKTKTVAIFGDDSVHFENFSRYYGLLFDYSFTTLKPYIKKYKEEGINGIFCTNLVDINSFKLKKFEKTYPLTFIGSQRSDKSGRYELIKYLIEKKAPLRVYGFGWENYPEFKEVYHGVLKDNEVLDIINKTKINLCFSKDNFGNPQLKARAFEVGACSSFILTEYAPDYLEYFKENKEIVFFKSKDEMLQKIDYYLKNEKEREDIAKNLYNKITKNYGMYNELKDFILKTKDSKKHNSLPKIKKRIFAVDKKIIRLPDKELKILLKDFDFISFKTENSQDLKYKDYFQAYSLIKTGKDISCCDYYASSMALGDYAMLSVKYALGLFDKDTCADLFYLSQLMVKKDFFIDNIGLFRKQFEKPHLDFLNMNNTAIVSIPLVRIKNFRLKDYKKTKEAFSFKFVYDSYAYFRKKKFISAYLIALFLSSIFGKSFIRKEFSRILLDKGLWTKLKKFNSG